MHFFDVGFIWFLASILEPSGEVWGVFGRPFGLQKMINWCSQSEFEEKLDFGAIWGRFGRGLEAQGAPFGRSLGALGELGGVFGTLLGASWCLWGVLLALLGSSWSSLGRSYVCLGPFGGQMGQCPSFSLASQPPRRRAREPRWTCYPQLSLAFLGFPLLFHAFPSYPLLSLAFVVHVLSGTFF